MKRLTAILILLGLVLICCTLNQEPPIGKGNKINVNTINITQVSSNSALSGGNIISDGGDKIIKYGVCWNISTNPTTSNFKNETPFVSNNYTLSLSNLMPNTTYFVRAYIINEFGTFFGNQISFKTISIAPSLSTLPIKDVTNKSVFSGGNIISDGGLSITAKGVCFSTTQNPTTLNNKTQDGTGNSSFSSFIDNLSPNTTYYLKAYATNSIGTSYGQQISFTTLQIQLPVILTNQATSITNFSAVISANIQNSGTLTSFIRGLCWGTNANPTISNEIAESGTGLGAYNIQLNNLNQNTTYYSRAYIKSGSIVYYGNLINFTTSFTPTLTLPANNSTIRCCNINLQWSKVQNATEYEVFIAKVPYIANSTVIVLPCNGKNQISTSYRNKITVTSNQICLDAGNSTYNGNWMWLVRPKYGTVIGKESTTFNFNYNN